MIYFKLKEFLKNAKNNKDVLAFDMDGTLCTAQYIKDGIVGIELNRENLKIRDSYDSPYLNGLVQPTVISDYLNNSDIKDFIVITGCFECEQTIIVKYKWLNQVFPDKNILFIPTTSFYDKTGILNLISESTENLTYIDDNLEALISMERNDCSYRLMHTSTYLNKILKK